MASYTDNPERLGRFNPYVQQLPVDAMVKVGMEKQQRYDQGIQKIQSQIDNVAGLDVVKDSHKQHLQSRLNELGNDLKIVAAADFSNLQITNSTAGMAASIAKDPIIQSAVYSTQVIRKGQQDVELAKQQGKSSVQNEAFWNKQINDWTKDPDLKTKFTGSYVPYTDINKKLRDVADKIHETDNSIDVPFQRDNAGNTIYFKTDPKTKQTTTSIDPNSGGVSRIDDAMLSIKTKGKPAEKILSNFMSSLDENDQRQLHIDSWYHYQGVTPDALKVDITNNYQNAKKLASERLVNLNVELTTNQNLSTSQKSALQARITSLSNDVKTGTLKKEYQSQLKEVDSGNIENYKYKIYTQKYLTTLAKDMAYESIQQEYKNNPYFQAGMSNKNLQFKYENASREQDNWNRTFAWEHEKFAATQMLGYDKLAVTAKAKAGSTPLVVDDRMSPEVDPVSMVKLESEIINITGKHVPGEPEVFGDIDKLNEKYAPILPGTKDLETAKEKKDYLDKLASKVAMDPSFIGKQNGAELKEYLKQRYAYDILAGQKQTLYTEAIKESGKFNDQINAVIKNEPDTVLSNGSRIKARDLFEFGANVEYNVAEELDEKKLKDTYKGASLEPLANAVIKSYRGGALTDDEKHVLKQYNAIRSKHSGTVSDIVGQKLQAESKFLNERMPERQVKKGALSSSNKADMDKVRQLITLTNDDYNTGGVDTRQKKDYNPNDIIALQNNPKVSVDYVIKKKYDGSAELTIQSGTTQYKIPMTAERLNTVFPEYSRRNPISEIKYDVLASPFKSTNIRGVTDGSSAVTAGIQGYSIPQIANTAIAPLVRMDVNGSAFNDGSGNDKYQVILYVNNNGTWIAETLNPEYVSDAGLQAIIGNIGTNTIDEILKKHKTQK